MSISLQVAIAKLESEQALSRVQVLQGNEAAYAAYTTYAHVLAVLLQVVPANDTAGAPTAAAPTAAAPTAAAPTAAAPRKRKPTAAAPTAAAPRKRKPSKR